MRWKVTRSLTHFYSISKITNKRTPQGLICNRNSQMTLKKTYYIQIALSFVLLVAVKSTYLRKEITHRFLQSDDMEEDDIGDILPEDIVNKTCFEKRFRFLTIGAKTSAGDGLLFANQSFPAQLCGGDVIAEQGISPLAVSSCLKNLIGDTIYDVIALDLFEVADQYLHVIIKRLRNRYVNEFRFICNQVNSHKLFMEPFIIQIS